MSSPFIFVLFLNFVLFHLFSLLVRDGSLDLVGGGGGGGGGLFASIEDVFFSCEFTVQDFCFEGITVAGIFFNTTLELFLCI